MKLRHLTWTWLLGPALLGYAWARLLEWYPVPTLVVTLTVTSVVSGLLALRQTATRPS